jgi:hypothetical protein
MSLTLDLQRSTGILELVATSPIEMENSLLELLDMLLSILILVSVFSFSYLEQSRRDDLEALGYVFVYFCKGSLPWQGLKGNTKKLKYDAIMEKKITTSTQVLCEGLPLEFATFIDYVKSLRFEDTPDYTQLRQMFRDLFISKGFVYDYVFDWILIKEEKDRSLGISKQYFKITYYRTPRRNSSAQQIIASYLP